MKRLILKFLGGVALFAAVASFAIFMWGRSDPEGCVAGVDPAVALANQNVGSEVYSDRCFEHDGLNLHVVEAQGDNPDAEVVLFIHGFPTIWYSMIRPMEAMRGDYRVIAIDGLGAGLSDAPSEVEPYRLAAMADHLDALIADVGVSHVHLVGHDWGAAFAGAYAQSRADRIASLTLMSAPPQNIAVAMLETSERQRAISQYVERLKGATPALALLTGTRGRLASGPQNHFEAGRMSAEEAEVLQDATSDLRRIDRHINWYRANLPAPDAISQSDYWPSRDARLEVPTLLIWGNDDTIFDPAFIALMEASATDLTVLRLDGVGHAPQLEATTLVNEALARHIEESRPDTDE